MKITYKNYLKLLEFNKSLDNETKKYFHPYYFNANLSKIKWLYSQIAILLSINPVSRRVLKLLFFKAVFFIITVVNSKGCIVGYSFLKLKKKCENNKFVAEFGIVIDRDYAGKGLGKNAMKKIIEIGYKNNVKNIWLVVFVDNKNAIHLYEKLHFVRNGIIKNGDKWKNTCHDLIIMELSLV